MTTSIRPRHLSIILFLLLVSLASAYARPSTLPNSEGLRTLTGRSAIIAYDASGNIKNITDSSTGLSVAQGAATDGGGTDFDASAIIWLVLSFVAGIPLMLGGLALPRMTTGMGIGLTATVCSRCIRYHTLYLHSFLDSMGSFYKLCQRRRRLRPDNYPHLFGQFRPRVRAGRI